MIMNLFGKKHQAQAVEEEALFAPITLSEKDKKCEWSTWLEPMHTSQVRNLLFWHDFASQLLVKLEVAEKTKTTVTPDFKEYSIEIVDNKHDYARTDREHRRAALEGERGDGREFRFSQGTYHACISSEVQRGICSIIYGLFDREKFIKEIQNALIDEQKGYPHARKLRLMHNSDAIEFLHGVVNMFDPNILRAALPELEKKEREERELQEAEAAAEKKEKEAKARRYECIRDITEQLFVALESRGITDINKIKDVMNEVVKEVNLRQI